MGLLRRKEEDKMYLVILKWVDGKLIVDEDSLHHFGTDIPEGFDAPQGAYTVKIKEINQLVAV